ncbi:MAG TPA: HAMP domain-containing sensor histidine kinase [Mucilaginibacter sp.]
MKLSAQYSKVNLIITISVLFIAGIIYYGTIDYIANNQLDRNLDEEIGEVADYVKINQRLPKQIDFDEDQTSFTKTDQKAIAKVFFDTVYRNPREKKPESGRAVTGLITLSGVNYKVIVIESKEATEYLIQLITLITLVLTALLLLILVIANRYILNGLWKPFYHILQQLKAFNIADATSIELSETKVDEFKELNDAVLSMSSRVNSDYQNLKTFTENASHEMMTPISVITSKLDTLIQDETLKFEQFNQINDIYAATNRLSRLNQSLLLLVKIENDLIQDSANLNLKDIITEKLHQFQELTQSKHIGVTHTLDDMEITASKYLIEILINNLFSNAIKHNIPYGTIRILLNDNKLIIQNTGENESLNEKEIFERFQKGKTSEGTGLGLTIVKNICSQYNFRLNYYFEKPLHSFQIDFV